MTDPKRNRRKLWWAVLASIVLHLLIGLSLAAFSRSEPPLAVEEPQAPQLTIMQVAESTPPPTVPKNAPTTTVDESRKSAEAPKEKTFEANENSIAAAEQAATTDSQLPGQDGQDRPFMNLEEHEDSLAANGAAPEPKPSATPPPKKESTPAETPPPATPPPATPTPEPDQLALLTQTPTPVPSPPEAEEKEEIPTPTEPPTPTPAPSETPRAPASRYQDYQKKTLIRGGINNRGRSAVNAVGTATGRYRKQLEDAIGARWYYFVKAQSDLINIGTTTVTFEVTSDGSVQKLRITENTANEASAGIALRSIQESKFPPIPDELHDTFPDGRFTMEESFTIFANR